MEDHDLDQKQVHKDHHSLLRGLSQVKFAEEEFGDGELVYELDSDEEREAFGEFKEYAKGHSIMEQSSEFWQLACLRARKFDAKRALELLERFEEWKIQYGVEEHRFHFDKELRNYMTLEVLAAPGNVDKTGRYMLTIRLGNQGDHVLTPREILCLNYYCLEWLLIQYPAVQSRGLVVCHDMKDARLSQFDSRVPREIMAAMSKNLPLRFGGAYVVNAPWFLRLIFPIVRTFMSKKMRDRMKMLGSGYSKLPKYIDEDQILPEMGGGFVTGTTEEFIDKMEQLHVSVQEFLKDFKVPAPGAEEKMPSYAGFVEKKKEKTAAPTSGEAGGQQEVASTAATVDDEVGTLI